MLIVGIMYTSIVSDSHVCVCGGRVLTHRELADETDKTINNPHLVQLQYTQRRIIVINVHNAYMHCGTVQ